MKRACNSSKIANWNTILEVKGYPSLRSCSFITEDLWRPSSESWVLFLFDWWSFLKTEGNHPLILICTSLRKHRFIWLDVLTCLLWGWPFGQNSRENDSKRCSLQWWCLPIRDCESYVVDEDSQCWKRLCILPIHLLWNG